MIRSVPFSATGIKRPQNPLPNPALTKRPNLAPSPVVGPAPGHHPNEFTPGGAPARDKPNQALTTSRFDDEFGDDFFYGTNLDKVIALTDMALKSSGLPPMTLQSKPIPIQTNSTALQPLGAMPQPIASCSASMQIPPTTSSVPMKSPGPMSLGQKQLPPKQLPTKQPPIKQPVVNPNRYGNGFHDSAAKQGVPFPHSIKPSTGQRAYVNGQQQAVSQNPNQGPVTTLLNTAPATPTQHVIYTEPNIASVACGKDSTHPSDFSLEEECNRLRTMYNECSQERGRLRLQQARLQKQIDDKTNTVILLRSKLSSLESQLSKTRAEMAHRAAQKNDAYKAQHERLEAQINTLNLERESLERELEEIGRTNESLTRALSSERQVVLALKRQVTGSNHFNRNNSSPEKDVSNHLPPSEDAVACQNSNVSLRRDGSLVCNPESFLKKSSISTQQNSCDRFLPKILSASLEDGLLELARCSGIAELYQKLGTGIENQIELLINGSYPVFYAVPILKPIIDSGNTSFMRPVLKVLFVLVSHDSRCRQIVLGLPKLSKPPQSSTCYFGHFTPELVPSPLWPKPGTCLAVFKSSMARFEATNNSLRSFYKPEEESIATDFIECPGIVNSLMTVLKNPNKPGSTDVIRFSLLILLELLRHAQNPQIPKFNALLDTGLLQSLFNMTADLSCQTIILMIFNHLLWYEDNLRWFTKNSSQPSALECAFKALEFRANPEEYQQATTLHLMAMDLIGFILAKYGQCGVKVIFYGSVNPEQRNLPEQQVLPKIAAVMTAVLDISETLQSERYQLVYKGISLIETLLLHVDATLQTAGYRFHFLSLLTRIMQVGDDSLADHASCCRLQLIESGCLDLLSKPGRSNDSNSFSA